VVGGYTGSAGLRSIVAFRPGAGARVVAQLPRPLRYAAVAAIGGRLVIAGGTSGVEPQQAVLAFDPATRRVTTLGRLPYPLTHASAAALGGVVYVIGGRVGASGDQTSAILAVDPATGSVRRAARLPEPLSDTAAVTSSSSVLILGGRDSAGEASDRISTLAASP
jgi:N-acetylneuraminic acid mutarotase